jgi:Uncharacterized protein conserved in bacteria
MKKPAASDIVLYGLLILAAIALFIPTLRQKSPEYVFISSEEGVYRYSLKTDRVVTVSGPLGESEVEIRNGEARISASPCPNQTCVRQGAVKHEGGMCVCLPNRVSIRVEGDSDVVAVSR